MWAFLKGVLTNLLLGGVTKWILIASLVSVVGTGAWGIYIYGKYRDVSEENSVLKSQVSEMKQELRRKDIRLKTFGEIISEREQRKEEWKEEALKWKNRMAELLDENKDIRHWYDDTYPAELD